MSGRYTKAYESKDAYLKAKYAITEEQYWAIYQKQGGKCGICHCHQRYKCLAVDHDHKTGMVRGLLCEQCNRGLGRFFDSALRLRAAADYVERAQATWDRVSSQTKREVKDAVLGS